MYNTPILFLIFNRPDTTQRVFDVLRRQQPKRLYVAGDGPRKHKPGEAELCRETREIIKQVDWDCEVHTLFREENLGCKLAVSSAITWFFGQEEQGIILEDDCLPHPSFFPYCEELLERYKDDDRIGHISGNCYFPELLPSGQSYDFSALPHIWGWATWRRVWEQYDVDFPYWRNRTQRNRLFTSQRDRIYFSSFLSDTLAGKHGINAWSPQYVFTLRLQSQLSIYPSVNMVTNIGLHVEDATHTQKGSRTEAGALQEMTFPLKHPTGITRNKELDNKTFRKLFFSWKRLIRYFLKDY